MPQSQDLSPKEIVKAGYDSITPAYLDFITNLPIPSLTWLDKVLALLPNAAESHVLELGCGPGVPCTKYLVEKVGNVMANDISSAQIDSAKKKLASFNNVTFVSGDMAGLSLGNETLNAVTAFYSLQHLPREEQLGMLQLIYGWLKPSGILLCNFDTEDKAVSIIQDWLGATMFHSGYGAEKSKQMIVDAGFEMLEAEIVSTVDGEKTIPFLWCLARKK